jgi:hypothetical protein
MGYEDEMETETNSLQEENSTIIEKIKYKIELTDVEKKLLDKSDVFYDLMFENYWDIQQLDNNIGCVQTRMSYDIPTCAAIKKFLTKLLRTGGYSIEQEM